MKKTGEAVCRFPYRMQICKSNTIARGLVQHRMMISGQNGFTTTNTTMAIIATVGNSLAIRKNRAVCGIRPAAKALRQPAKAK